MKRANLNGSILAILLSVAACSQGAEQPATNRTQPSEDRQEAAPVPSLAGEWIVTQINGTNPDQIWPMTAEVGNGRFTIVSECRKTAWNVRQDRNIVQFTPAPEASVDCARIQSPAEEVADKAIKLANIAMFVDEGRTVEISGPGGRLAMTRR
jgi:hypothetical protein